MTFSRLLLFAVALPCLGAERLISLGELARSLPPGPITVVFDVDDTALFTSPGFQWGTRTLRPRHRLRRRRRPRRRPPHPRTARPTPRVLGQNEQRPRRIQRQEVDRRRVNRAPQVPRRQNLLRHQAHLHRIRNPLRPPPPRVRSPRRRPRRHLHEPPAQNRILPPHRRPGQLRRLRRRHPRLHPSRCPSHTRPPLTGVSQPRTHPQGRLRPKKSSATPKTNRLPSPTTAATRS